MSIKQRYKKVFSFLLMGIFFLNDSVFAKDNTPFLDFWKYEVNNREFAFQIVSDIASRNIDGEQKEFWDKYYELESLSRHKYKAVIKKYDVGPNNFLVAKKVLMSKIELTILPDPFYKMMYQATYEYASKLEVFPKTCSNEDIVFCQYVVEQEKAQVKAMSYVIESDFSVAASVIDEFIKKSR